MLTTARNLKRCARVLVTDERIWSSSRSYAGVFDWVTDGIICFMLFVTIIWLCLKSKPQHFQIENTLNGIVINSELAALPENLCCIWSSTRDFRQRKFYFTCNHRYGIELRTGRKLLHVILCILLAGDIATNPGPCSFILNSDAKNTSDLKVLYLNARSLKSFVSIDYNPTNKVCKITLLQELVHSSSYEVICICETWLNNTVFDADLLPGFEIFRRGRTVKTGGGSLLR